MAYINYTGQNVFTFNAVGAEPVQFVPGINEITSAQLDAISLHPAFKSFVDDEKLIVLPETKGKDGERPVKEMLGLIAKMYDAKLLRKLIQADSRAEIQKAAQEQLDSISVPKKDDGA
jgi:hypothetical protein